jgi:ketosteroid isomerase-like protein
MGENADVIRAAWEAFGRQDLDTATGVLDEGGEVVVPQGLPWGGTYRGPDGFKEMLGQFMGNMDEFSNEMSGRALWMYELSGGKVRRAELFADTAQTVEAIS